MNIKEDLEKYPCFILRHKKLIKTKPLDNWGVLIQAHHFIKQNVRKTSPEFYERVEHLQKIIFMPAEMHYNLHSMSDVRFFERYGMNKNDLLFNRKKWREGYYGD